MAVGAFWSVWSEVNSVHLPVLKKLETLEFLYLHILCTVTDYYFFRKNAPLVESLGAAFLSSQKTVLLRSSESPLPET